MSVTDEIKSRLDVVDVISGYVPLKKAGRNYKGLCPFHNEKTPSFVVFPETQGWHCFGACGIGGDIFTFVMKRENLDFGEALALLAAKAGVELQPRESRDSGDDAQIERYRAIVADAAVYFHYLLNKAGEAAIARETLARRGFTEATWEAWQLGYSLDSWDALRDRLTGKGYRLDEIEATGLVIRRDDGSGHYDRFRGRLMIPIRDAQGRTIGFGARILREDPARPAPKYINSPQGPLFDKGNVLYGLDMARKAIRDENLAVLVEGYMDVIMSHQVGVCNVVAGMGTALGETQMRQLKRYTGNITLALDPDVAGDHATLRGLEAARQSLEREWEPVISPTGLVRQESRLKAQLRIAALPDGLDPDELACRDVDRWRQVIAQARPIVDYYLAIVGREEELGSARGKANAVERMAPLIAEIANPVERGHYVQVLARLVQADERLIAAQIAAIGRGADLARQDAGPAAGERGGRGTAAESTARRGAPDQDHAVVRVAVVQARPGLEEHILGWLFLRPDLLAGLDADMIGQQAPPLGPEDFSSAEGRALLVGLQAGHELPEDATPDDRLAELPEPLREYARRAVAGVLGKPSLPDDKLTKDLGDSLLRLRERNLRSQIRQVESLIQEGEAAGATEERDAARALHELMAVYSAQKRHIHKLLDVRSMAGALAKAQADRKT
jgi:DNA primase